MSVEHPGDQVVAPRVVIENPGGEADGRIGKRVQSLGSEPHLVGVTEPFLIEEIQLVPRVPFLG